MNQETELKQRLHIFNSEKKGINYGYSKHFNFIYDKKRIPSRFMKLKEWDFYQVSNDRFVLQMTIGHLSYVSNASVTLIDLKEDKHYHLSRTSLFHRDKKIKMENDGSIEHYLRYDAANFHILFDTNNFHVRRLSFDGNSKEYPVFEVELKLTETKPYEAMSIHTPFIENKNMFFLNYKLNCMKVSGIVRVNDLKVKFEEHNSFAVLDWGRGVWPKKTQWYWSNGSGMNKKQEMVGFNFGFGFGNPHFATENMVFHNGKAYKIKNITLSEHEDLMKPYSIIDDEARLFLQVEPLYDNHTKNGNFLASMEVHQIFSYFTGFYLLEDGSKIEFDHILAFFEYANNKW